MKALLALCLTLLSLQTTQAAFAQSASPSDEERRRIEEFERKRARALNIERRVTAAAVGINESDCLHQADYRLARKTADLIRDCERDAEGSFPCQIVAKRILEYPGPIRTMSIDGSFDERKSTEDTCRAVSVSRAEANALSACRDKFDVDCEITSRGIVTSHRTYKRRRFIIMGPREEYQECHASAGAAPGMRYRIQCEVEMLAKPQVR